MAAARFFPTVFIIIAMLAPAFYPQVTGAQVPNVGTTGSSSGCPQLSRDLERGMSGADVRELQLFLVAGGYLSSADYATGPGTFGGRTQAAVQRFQAAHGVPATGYVGPITRAAIARVCGGLPGGGGGALPAGVHMSASPTSGNAPLNVVFTITASSGYCGNYHLDFGDGAFEDMKNFCGTRTLSHTYNGQGTRTARLERFVGSSRTQVALVNIGTGSGPVASPSCTMTLSKNTIQKGATTTVSWSSSGATKAVWDDGTETGTSGSQELRNLATTTVKSITFRGDGGTKKCSVTVTVTPPPSGGVTFIGNATANGSVAELPAGGQNAYKLAEFQLKTASQEAVTMKKLVFTLRNQTAASAPGAATVSNYRVTIGTASYAVTVTKSGVYETGTVTLGSGVSVAASQTLGVAIFADVVPNAGGHLDLWIYPADTEFVGATSALAITPVSEVTNRVDTSLLYWSGWIAVRTGGGSSGGSVSGACVLDGVGYAVSASNSCSIGSPAGRSDLVQTEQQCSAQANGMNCTANGWSGPWAGAYINPNGVSVGCTTGNSIASPYTGTTQWNIPGNMKVQGNRCTDDATANALGNACTAYYICKRDGWWRTDSAGFEVEKVSSPWILPEQFYPSI